MKDKLDKCFNILLKHKCGVVNHPEDLGRATNLDGTKRMIQEFLGRPVLMDEMKALIAEDVKPFYKKTLCRQSAL